MYFFERGLGRATEWATKIHTPCDPGVLRAEISLERCWDLTDSAGITRLRPFYEKYVQTFGRQAVARLKQRGGARRLDCAVINFACALLEDRGEHVAVIRHAFNEGSPVWIDEDATLAPAGIVEGAHVQLAVRELTAISNVSIVELQGVD